LEERPEERRTGREPKKAQRFFLSARALRGKKKDPDGNSFITVRYFFQENLLGRTVITT
jgi:hypothetical protein